MALVPLVEGRAGLTPYGRPVGAGITEIGPHSNSKPLAPNIVPMQVPTSWLSGGEPRLPEAPRPEAKPRPRAKKT